MVFKVQILNGNKPVEKSTVKMSEPGFFGGMSTMRHTGNGWYECSSNKSSGTIFIDGEDYGSHPNSDTIYKK